MFLLKTIGILKVSNYKETANRIPVNKQNADPYRRLTERSRKRGAKKGPPE